MAVGHDVIMPYLKLGRFTFHAFAFAEELLGTIDFSITVDKADEVKEIYNRQLAVDSLVYELQRQSVEKVFGLEKELNPGEASELDSRKANLIDYLQKLERHYDLPGWEERARQKEQNAEMFRRIYAKL
jgi:hypothetical protein